MKTIVIAVDPGKLSGVVALDLTQSIINNCPPAILLSDELEQMETCQKVTELLEQYKKDGYDVSVVMEDFFITTETGKKRDTRFSLEIIGYIRYAAHVLGVPFFLQSPGDAKHVVDNDRLRDMHLWVPGGEGHAKDAMRHAILFMVRWLRLLTDGFTTAG